jgi:SAM-dependent methyltransferase
MSKILADEVRTVDPYALMAVLGKGVIHPGGRRSTEELLKRAKLEREHHVLDVGCGVGTTAIQIARRFGARVTAVDIAPLMLERARANVASARADDLVDVRAGDILALDFPDGSFDRVVAEAVTMFVDRSRAARELVRVCQPGGLVLTTEFLWRTPPPPKAHHAFLGELCPGMTFDTLEDWVALYGDAGLTNIHVASGPFEMMTARGFLSDEGLLNSVAIMARAVSRPAFARRMAWMMPRIRKAVPYLGYVVVSGVKTEGRGANAQGTS